MIHARVRVAQFGLIWVNLTHDGRSYLSQKRPLVKASRDALRIMIVYQQLSHIEAFRHSGRSEKLLLTAIHIANGPVQGIRKVTDQ